MTVCTTSGRIIWSNYAFPGRMTDNQIMAQIFTEPEKCNAEDLVDLCRTTNVIFIADRGFRDFKKWLATKPEFNKVVVKLPCDQQISNEDDRYPRKDADLSRLEITSRRHIVEQVHGAQARSIKF